MQLLAITIPAMAAAVETEHGHPCRDGACDASDAVLDHEATFRRDVHLFGGEQKQVGCGLAVAHLYR